MPKVSEQYKDRQRSEILDAARRCFVRNGFHRTSMQDVFAEAGRSAGAVYRYFPRKDDMIVGVAEQNLDDIAGVLRAALADEDGDRALGQVVGELLEVVVRRHEDRDLPVVALMVWSEALRDPVLARRLREAVATMGRDLADLVRARQHAGEWAGASAEALAQAVLCVLPGFLFQIALLGPDGVVEVPDAVRVLWPS